MVIWFWKSCIETHYSYSVAFELYCFSIFTIAEKSRFGLKQTIWCITIFFINAQCIENSKVDSFYYHIFMNICINMTIFATFSIIYLFQSKGKECHLYVVVWRMYTFTILCFRPPEGGMYRNLCLFVYGPTHAFYAT